MRRALNSHVVRPDKKQVRQRHLILCALLIALSLASGTGCAGAGRGTSSGPAQTGVASYYADKYHGRRTASGERFDQRKMTAAHRTLPFGTKVRVTDPANGRSVVVRVNDRGPFVKGRVIDLSRAAAERLGIVRAGLADVRIEVLATPTALAGVRHE